jgi:hypothetical protein
LDVEDQPEGGSLDSKMLITELAVGYQIDGWAEGQTFDLLIGARSLRTKMELDPKNGSSTSKDNSLLDPILVVRPNLPLFPSKVKGLSFNPTFAIGAGGDADMVYELFPQFQYQVNDSVVTRLGYRRVGYKFTGDKNSDNEMNIALAGLLVGVGFTF